MTTLGGCDLFCCGTCTDYHNFYQYGNLLGLSPAAKWPEHAVGFSSGGRRVSGICSKEESRGWLKMDSIAYVRAIRDSKREFT